jgi:uncharacterized membrane protein YbaN (DUF454 family)
VNGPRGPEAGAVDASARPASTRPFVDYTAEMQITRNPALRTVFRLLGAFFLALGTAGYILPGLPGTVFILISAFFFARSSPRFYNWLMNHRVFGGWIKDFRAGRGLPGWVKVYAPMMIVAFSAASIYVWARRGTWWAVAATFIVAAYGVYYILKQPTRPKLSPNE